MNALHIYISKNKQANKQTQPINSINHNQPTGKQFGFAEFRLLPCDTVRG
jgi:hypothetical protein